MGISDRVGERLRSRANPAPASPSWTEGEPWTADRWQDDNWGNYLATSDDVFSVANLRAKMLAKLPLLVRNSAGVDQPASALARLLARPNPFWTRYRLMKFTELCLCLWGEAYWVLERGGGRKIREIWPVKPTMMSPVASQRDYIRGFVLSLPDGSRQPFPIEDVVWIQSPNPNDLLAPLSPLAPARLAADISRASMLANRNLFAQGMMGGGFVAPAEKEQAFTVDQANDLEKLIDRRFKGVDKAHRWSVLRYALNLQAINVTPRDAQFVEGMNVTFRRVCRVYGVPPPLVGDAEFATLANLSVYDRQFWELTGQDEAVFLGSEIDRQITPAFPESSSVAFDLSGVVALQEDENAEWTRSSGQLDKGVITINEWRVKHGLDEVEWGDVPLALASSPDPDDDEEETKRERPRRSGQRAATLRTKRYDSDEAELAAVFVEICGRIEDAIEQRLRQRGIRSLEDAARDPFDLPRWTDRTRAASAARFVATTEKSILLEGRKVGLSPTKIAELIEARATRAAIEAQTRRFAERVTLTTWQRVQESLSKGLRKHETIEQMARRIRHVMGVRIEQARMIAQSEVTRAVTTGQMAAYTTAGVPSKRWRTQADELVRETHSAVDGLVLPTTEDFAVGYGSGPGPGQIGVAEEDINCRCYLEPVAEETPRRVVAAPLTSDDLPEMRVLAAALDVSSGS